MPLVLPKNRRGCIAAIKGQCRSTFPSLSSPSKLSNHHPTIRINPTMTSTRPLAIITGANRGIGFGLAKELHATNFDVLVTARDAGKAAEAANTIKATSGPGTVDSAALDTSDATSITTFISKTLTPLVRDAKRTIYFVNNAGIVGTDSFRPVLTTNVIGPIKLTQAFIDLVEATPSVKGAVINVSSSLGNKSFQLPHLLEDISAHPFKPASEIIAKIESGAYDAEDAKLTPVASRSNVQHHQYNFSKHLLNIATELQAKAHPSVPVIALCPGWVQTDMGGPNASGTIQSAVDRVTFHVKADFDQLPARAGKLWVQQEVSDWRNK
ncbi:hypothetical protein DFS34DRAFT_631910 [Phlyctochytrium arcticum]|nr:hypothetical protein DFS34DRAFT_631910 [Phlyctochytrium arcticum]